MCVQLCFQELFHSLKRSVNKFPRRGQRAFYHPLPNEDGDRIAVKQSGTPDCLPAILAAQMYVPLGTVVFAVAVVLCK